MTADQWNELVPPGTPVRYWSARNESRPWFEGQSHVDTRTRSEAWHLPGLQGGHTMVMVEGVSGAIWVEHLRVDAAKVMRDATAAVKSQLPPLTIRMEGGEVVEVKSTAEQFKAAALELLPEQIKTLVDERRDDDCKCAPGGICWSCLARGESGP